MLELQFKVTANIFYLVTIQRNLKYWEFITILAAMLKGLRFKV